MIDYLIEMTCMHVCALLYFYHLIFYMSVSYHVDYCNVARVLVQCQRYAIKQMFIYYYYYFLLWLCNECRFSYSGMMSFLLLIHLFYCSIIGKSLTL